ncbi:MAG TPA: TonB-dependent receptor, partial [Marinilabiliales bacterium]|nr:TonB-dependent receptor [Marinilabiliales bacterium]
LTGWMSYTLSRTLRKFNNINDGYWYPAKYDRVHDFSITMNYQLNDRWNLSALWVYATGNAMTLPAGRYIIQGNVVNDYTDVNSFRMPAYHRLDLSATRQLKKKEHWESDLVLSVYNVYNRANPYFIYFRVKGDIDHYYLSVNPRQISLFPILPALTLNFKFY